MSYLVITGSLIFYLFGYDRQFRDILSLMLKSLERKDTSPVLSLFDFFLYQRTKFVQKQHHRTPARLVWAP